MPVEYATVVVADAQTGKTVGGGVADNEGKFDIGGLGAGRF